MNPTLAISLLYGLMTLGTVSILYFSFKGKVDFSGRFFLLGELLMLLTAGYLSLISIEPSYKLPWVSFLGNVFYFSGELSILFSIYALTHSISMKKYLLAVVGICGYCAVVEYANTQNTTLSFLLYPLVFFVVSMGTYIMCAHVKDTNLKSNQFLRWFKNLELALTCISTMRIMLYLTGTVLMPTGANYSAIVLYVCYVAINLFRFISYQSLRMTWVPEADHANFLNSRLARSIQENNRLVNRLLQSNRMLGMSALAGSLAHQLSQPLTGAALETESIKRDLSRSSQDQGATESLNKVSSQLNKLSELVRNLRKLFGAKEQPFKSISLIGLCDEVLALTEPTTTAKKIIVSADYHSNPFVNVDSIQIQQVLINLINNAIEAVLARGIDPKQITLRIEQNETLAFLTVEDNGPGIAADVLPTIFDLYKSTKEGGMGIGLWLSKTIVTRHQGEITAANKADYGAIFIVQLPLTKV